MRTFLSIAVMTAAISASAASAETMSPEQMAAKLMAFEARLKGLEAQSRRDRADAEAARAELRAVRAGTRRPAPAATASPQYAALAPPAPSPAVVLGGSFSGPYVAAFGGYQFGTERQAQGNFVSASLNALSGGSVGGLVGYNATVGRILVGGEARGRTHFDRTEGSGAFAYSFPGFSYTSSSTDKLTREYGGDLALRAGIVWDDTAVYLRIGGGADAIRRRTAFSYFSTFDSGGSRDAKVTASPYTILGLGVEQNFGPWFARIEGAFLNHYDLRETYSGSQYYTTEITGAVGYRF